MRMFSILLLVGALLFGAAFVTAPFFAFRALKAATQVEDVAAITELVDFPAVRESLSRQVAEAAAPRAPAKTAEAPSIWKDPLGAIRQAITPLAPSLTLTPPEPQVDRYLTPAGLYALTLGYEPGQAPPDVPAVTWKARAVKLMHASYGRPIYWDVNRARLAVSPPGDTTRRTIFTFQRKTLFSWKLVHIRLPKPAR